MRRGLFSRYIGGLILIGIGVLFLLNQLGYTQISIGYIFSTFWPVFVIFAGLSQVMNGRRYGSSAIGGLIITIVGVYFLGRNLGLVDLSPGDFFRFFVPAALILGGICILFKPGHDSSRRGRRRDRYDYPEPPFPPEPPYPPTQPSFHPEMKSPLDEAFGEKFGEKPPAPPAPPVDAWEKKGGPKHYNYSGPYSSQEKINKSGFIGDVHIGRDYFELKPMNISHFIGDTVIDLTKAQIPYGETRINVASFIGDVKVFMPDEMDVAISVTTSSFIGDMKVLNEKQGGFLNNVQSSSPHYGEAGRRVKLFVSVFVGDVRVNMVG
ncbi:cell wall-active antibiotics response protein LiaF [Paenibacillus sp. YPG26]|uniref:cell wall-active antibiotics response protein LiaF n=1 Tax=Paenibacillus sp. YPG26 TaxID=2878915 RepID=UPI00203F3F20|nr:cell wall-active antibiotics response protein LiaF [Paenibacillus sp. YPG26]USB32442.1 cell wall-active antibiotics response protein LiaF [Paenibacillus sp. YPG26]